LKVNEQTEWNSVWFTSCSDAIAAGARSVCTRIEFGSFGSWWVGLVQSRQLPSDGKMSSPLPAIPSGPTAWPFAFRRIVHFPPSRRLTDSGAPVVRSEARSYCWTRFR